MNRLFSLLVTVVAIVTSQQPGQDSEDNGEGIKEVMVLRHHIGETISTVASSQCGAIKKLLGLSFDQMQGEKEPDLETLSVVYRTKSFSHVYSISSCAESLLEARAFESRGKLVIYVHGFEDDPHQENFSFISESLLQSADGDDITLLALDASSLIRWMYLRATTYVIYIGKKLAELLTTLVQKGLEPSRIHLVGHSLGAHICGFTGKHFFILTGQKIGRISGLDPAGPCFKTADKDWRLRESDADYVDVMHTNAGVLGIKTPLGHADYYPNGGAVQLNVTSETGSHLRAVRLYGESAKTPDAFPALRCDSWEDFTRGKCNDEISYMGYESAPATRGLFFLQTGGKDPYGRGMDGIKYVSNNDKNVGLGRDVLGIIKKLPILG